MDTLIPWTPCDCCDDFICNYHGTHAADCECPHVERWSGYAMWPYSETKIEDLEQLLKDINP